jgi:hypothetical protein
MLLKLTYKYDIDEKMYDKSPTQGTYDQHRENQPLAYCQAITSQSGIQKVAGGNAHRYKFVLRSNYAGGSGRQFVEKDHGLTGGLKR